MAKRASVLVVAVVAALVVSASSVEAVAGFEDVPAGAYYSAAVQWMVDNGITTGTSATTFSPDAVVSRGQAAAFLWRMEGRPSAPRHSFTDVTAEWQQTPVSWMASTGITAGHPPPGLHPTNL